jgi:hypothetical protein
LTRFSKFELLAERERERWGAERKYIKGIEKWKGGRQRLKQMKQENRMRETTV